jgi:toxin ParE1/3/4
VKHRAAFFPRAEIDQAEIYDYLARQSLATARRFVDKVDETLQKLCSISTPGMPWLSENQRLAGLRWAKVRRFPNHLIFFRVADDLLSVTRILHGARDLESILE